MLQREDAARDDGETDKGGRGDQSRRGLKPGTVVSLTCAQHGRALSVRSRGRSRSDRVGVDERNADQNDEDELDERSSSRLRVVTQSSVVSSPRTDSRALEAMQSARGEASYRTRTCANRRNRLAKHQDNLAALPAPGFIDPACLQLHGCSPY